ncbi:hypothetical protein ONE63_001372 [Megalurothrips usitatus]|uniref:Protein downstream neighbor of son homolog n=1 Tax=Megalurothrips usitatus TaxID=439358 RepID=A0AAV7XJ74_9NEOP|nr:hypothetical protein ONE63_001372 [Megalurothrips usitatus]
MDDNSSTTPPKWKRPEEVMRLHMMKKRRAALAARMSRSSSAAELQPSLNVSTGESQPPNKRNCFRRSTSGVKRSADGTPVLTELDASSDNTLFHLLNSESSPVPAANSTPTSFSSILKALNPEKKRASSEGAGSAGKASQVPIDWTLRTKVRFMSPKPFPFNATLRTCEEASGITGFVRCVDTGLMESSLDTSPNARLHQCCLVWQHPSLPWLELYPRQAARVSSADSNINIASMPSLRESLQRDWARSFQSLFQLVRARQCPYFYVCANNFTCLFRAAGMCGISETHALTTPTTRGFRQLLKEEDVEFTMPLKKNSIKRKSLDGASSESGYETLDSVNGETNSQTAKQENNEDDPEEEKDEEDDVSNDKWLESMGIEAAEIRRLNTVQVQQKIDRERDIDKTPESLIMVEGIEAQALFNFLLNCKSCTATTGALAGIPPTLLAPVAFHGATLRPNKVRVSKVQVENSSYHSVELQGPVLPHAVLDLCNLLKPTCDQFSLTFANLETTKAFSEALQVPALPGSPSEKENQPTNNPAPPPCVFGQENLVDCGLSKDNLELFCSSDSSKFQLMESVKFSNGMYTWM